MKTGERGDESVGHSWAQNGYRVYARRPRSEIYDRSIDPERADEIEDLRCVAYIVLCAITAEAAPCARPFVGARWGATTQEQSSSTDTDSSHIPIRCGKIRANASGTKPANRFRFPAVPHNTVH